MTLSAVELGQVFTLVSTCWPSWRLPEDNTEADATFALWQQMLGQFDRASVAYAIQELAAEGGEFAPPPGKIRNRTLDVIKRQSSQRRELESGAPRVCQLCDGDGWRFMATNTVERCRCYRAVDSHPTGCSCMTCHYGPDRAARIRAGTDGSYTGSSGDPVQAGKHIAEIRQEAF